MRGRFAPSPTGRLHLGNLRTALAAWLYARHGGSEFLVRMEDLDTAVARREHEAVQLADLTALGLDWDGPIVRQSERVDRYGAAVDRLAAAGLVYECYCTRREIQLAASAPNAPDGGLPDGAYPGTCRELEAGDRRRHEAAGRRPALRLRTAGEAVVVRDLLHGEPPGGAPPAAAPASDASRHAMPGLFSGAVDDLVLVRNDGTYAYNLAVVVDDAAQGIELVVRGDDLLPSTPRQVHLARVLGLAVPEYAHVPLVCAPDGTRLAKRHGAVTLPDRAGAERAGAGQEPAHVLAWLAASLGLVPVGTTATTANELLERFDPAALPAPAWTEPWVLAAHDLTPGHE